MASHWQIQQTARMVQQGGVIAYPTEAVWGVGCDPFNEDAVLRLLALKNRPMHKGVILVAGDISQFAWLLKTLPEAWLEQLRGSWPGPNTWLVPHQNLLPEWITGKHDSVALRVTDHPLVKALCAHTGPIVSTSANLAGHPSARSRLRVEQYFHGQLDAILAGELGGRRNASLIRDLRTGAVVRPS